MHVTLRQLRAFEAVFSAESFTDAAKSLHISQAALSALVKELENQVGVRLLDRTTRAVTATETGGAFAPLVQRVLEDLDRALEHLTDLKELRRGVVRVAAPETLSCTLMPELIALYSGDYPDVDVRFVDMPIEDVFSSLQSGATDIGLGPFRTIESSEIDTHRLWKDPLWVALRPDDVLAGDASVSWRALRQHTLITHMRTFNANVLSHVPTASHPRGVVQVQRINTALAMARIKHDSVVVCPSLAAPVVEGFGLKFLPLEQPAVDRTIALYVRRSPTGSPAVERFLSFTLEFAKSWRERNRRSVPTGLRKA